MHKNSYIGASEQRVLIFQAQTPKVSDRHVYFLFSLRQMEDILMDAVVQPVPFSPSYLAGVADWQDLVMPVISLEQCLGLDTIRPRQTRRMMVVRTTKEGDAQAPVQRSMLRAVPPIQMVTLPIECVPVSAEWIPEKRLVRGVYEWQKGYLVVVHMGKILNGELGSGS